MFPQSLMVQINLGDTAVQKGDLALAAACYERALAIEPGNPIATKNLESVRTKIGK
jgi:Tfp pilus assembly protein PilF